MFKLSFELNNVEGRMAGDYTVNKIFHVSGNQDGIVVQRVRKQTTAQVKDDGRILNTTEAISAFTSNKVQFACDSYLEYFEIRGGELYPRTITDGFAGGAIAKYEKRPRSTVYNAVFDDEDPTYMTTGEIVHMGDNIFLTGQNEAYVRSLPWITGRSAKAKPSNGLPYLDVGYWDQILAATNSNVLTHTVVVRWIDSGPSHIRQEGGRRRGNSRRV